MKKIFTLVMAAVATLGASAFTPQSAELVEYGSSMLNPEAVPNHVAAPVENAMMSRAGVNMAGEYFAGMFMVVTDNNSSTITAKYTQDMNMLEVVADPSRENGYIVKGFLKDFFRELGTTNDLKAVYDPNTGVFAIDPYQVLIHMTFSDGTEGDLHVIAAVKDPNDPNYAPFKMDAPLELTCNTEGVMFMNSAGFMLGWFGGANNEKIYGLPYQVGSLACFIPNGSVEFVGPEGSATAPICAIPTSDKVYIYNFVKTTALNYATFTLNGDLLIADNGTEDAPVPCAQIIIESETYQTNAFYFLCTANENGSPDTSAWFELTGKVETANADDYEVTFPNFGVFDAQDNPWILCNDTYLQFDPSRYAGIENVTAAADNAIAPVVYYNLQGMRVNNPEGGIFIRVQGTETAKVVK